MTRLTPMHVFAFRHADDARISPDASRICHVLVRRDLASDSRKSVLMLTTDRETWHELPGSAGASAPRWAPDSRRLAILRRAEGRTALVVLDTEGGPEKVILDGTAPLREVAWSPDGQHLAFQMMVEEPDLPWLSLPQAPEGATWAAPWRVTDKLLWRHDTIGDMPHGMFQTFVCSPETGAEPRQLTNGPWFSGFHHPPHLGWTADGQSLLLAATTRADWDMTSRALDIHEISVADGSARQITHVDGLTGYPAASPDGAWIAYTTVDERGLCFQSRKLFVMPRDGGTAREILAGQDVSIDSLTWDGDRPALLVLFTRHGRRSIARTTLDGELTLLVDDVGGPGIEMPYSNGGFSVARDGTIAYLSTVVDRPGDVAVLPPDGKPAVLTTLNAHLATEIGGFVGAETVWVDSTHGGPRIQSWLMLPHVVPEGGAPLILSIHGGPFADFGERFSIKHQMMAAAGYAVLYVNPRGSTGYGEDFANALHDLFPGPDYDDLMDTLDVVAARPEIDAENLFVTGISGGGVLTLWSVTHTHRFRAAVSIKPVVSWTSWTLTADIGATIGPVWLGGALPWTDPDKLHIRSPLAHVAAARTPTMLIAGDVDHRTPASEAQQMYAAFKLCGVETALVRAPAVSHSSTVLRPSHFAAEVMCTLGWFERFRQARSDPGPT